MREFQKSKALKKARLLEQTLGDGKKIIEENEKDAYVVQRRSICARRFIPKGKVLQKKDLIFLRPLPPGAFHPYEEDKILGKIAKKDIHKYNIITKKTIK